MSDLTDAYAEALSVVESSDISYQTIEITYNNNGSQTSIYIVNSSEPLTARLETKEMVTFAPFSFDLALPDTSKSKPNELKITVDNITRQVSDFIDMINDLNLITSLIYRPFLKSTLLISPASKNPFKFTVTKVNASLHSAVFTCVYDLSFLNNDTIKDYYTKNKYLGLI